MIKPAAGASALSTALSTLTVSSDEAADNASDVRSNVSSNVRSDVASGVPSDLSSASCSAYSSAYSSAHSTAYSSDSSSSASIALYSAHRTSDASSSMGSLQALDVEAVWKAYSREPESLPPDVLDLSSVLYKLYKAFQVPGSLPMRQLHSLVQSILRSPTLHLPAHPGLLQLALATQPMMRDLLSGALFMASSRSRGCQMILNTVCELWDRALSQSGGADRPLTIRKPLPLHRLLLARFASVVGVTLGPYHPREGTRLAATADGYKPSPSGTGLTHAKPYLSIVSTGDALRLESHLIREDKLQRGRGSAVLLPTLAAALTKTARRGGHLQDALDRFNRKVARQERLLPPPDLSRAMLHAPLVESPISRAETTLWFSYAQLATASVLDTLVDDPLAKERLATARSLVAQLTEQMSDALQPLCNGPTQTLRRPLVAGCGVQLMIEASQLKEETTMRFHFQAPVATVMARMTPLEQTVLKAVADRLDIILLTLNEAPSDLSGTGSGSRSFVCGHTGDPMGCVVLSVDTHPSRTDAGRAPPSGLRGLLGRICGSDLAGTEDAEAERSSASQAPNLPPAPPTPDEVARALRRWLEDTVAMPADRFDQLRPLPFQPEWVRLLAPVAPPPRGLPRSAPRSGAVLLGSHPADNPFVTDYDRTLDTVLASIRSPGDWSGFSAELAPRFIADCQGWPAGRPLHIFNILTGTLLDSSGGDRSSRTPIRVARWAAGSHYLAVVANELVNTPADGDCFYTAVLAAMPDREREFLLRVCGCADKDLHDLRSAALALRWHFAAHLNTHRAHYRDRIIPFHTVLH